MPLTVGSRFGTYEALALIGAGGMGEVYRARDLKLGRDVAIKVLAAAYTSDPDRLARFEQEARTLAALNHPNIATIYGFEDAGDVLALVMELVDGETLRQRLVRAGRGTSRTLPLREALGIARQIADALDAAHARGIVHRDLKPENVKITPSGTVKVLDFGLAKIRDPNEGTPAGSELATSVAETRIGTVLGTAAYMSPEQARGLPVDRRTDVWSFGCVLYELLTGRAAFAGPTSTDTLAAVLEREPDWGHLPAALPPTIRRLLQRCLQKDLQRRLRDIGDVAILIEDALAEPAPVAADTGPAPRRVGTLALAGVALVAVLAAAALVAVRELRSTPEPPPAPLARFSISSPWPVIPPTGTAVSPDGRRIAFVAADDASGEGVLVVRALDSVDVRALPGTQDARHPVWSPDGRSIAFHAQGQIRRVDADGGPVVTVADAANGGVTWSKDDLLLFERADGLWSVPAAGGTPARVTTVDPARDRHTWPHFLPDGRRFLYFVASPDAERRGVYVGTLDSGEVKRVLATDFQARYAPPGHLLFVRNEQILAQPFDLERLELTGQPTIVADGVWVAALAGRASFSVSDNGALTYVNASQWNNQLAWFDRRGALLGELGPPERYAGQMPDISPGGRRVAIARGIWSQEQVWVLDANDATPTRVTFDSARALGPIWSGDSRRLMYESWTADGTRRLVIKDVATAEERIVEVAGVGITGRFVDWSPDGRFAVFTQGSASDLGLWALTLDDEHGLFALTSAPGNEFQAQLSPDGRWIAYTSTESGREEIYVQRFPDGGGKRQVSPAGGASPRWRPDGTELYYIARDGYVTAVAVRSTEPLDLGPATPLFRSRAPFLDAANGAINGIFDVTADGQRFLINSRSGESSAPITIVTNWPAALR